jgi:ribosomal protein S18 acetylase RimI-like enzyme
VPADEIDARRIETLHLRATAPREQLEYDGWLVRRALGDVKRARSVNTIGASTLPLDEKIARCEALFAEAGLPSVFRLTPFATEGLDGSLARHGYDVQDRSLQQVARLERFTDEPAPALQFESPTLDEWLAVASPLRQQSEVSREAEARRLAASDMDVTCALALADREVVACGLLLQASAYATVMDVYVAETRRGRGYGTALTTHLLRLAAHNGARIVWLSVLADNAAAIRTYAHFGFQTLYEYWYRVKA